ncbi:MAG: hypothetical protein ACKVP0_05960 [Pirellulaceae bacterium]
MLSRGKLVQDWRRRLAAAEADGAEGERRTWLAQMRLRLYRFLLSCYQDADWRADEPSMSTGETLADVARGDTTTLLDVRLEGKPAKTTGKMQAVLKSVSAAQDHPAEAGPLLGGIGVEESVAVVEAHEELDKAACQELLRQFGIASTWTTAGEIKVRLFDQVRALQLIRSHRESLINIPPPPIFRPKPPAAHISPGPVYFAALVVAPIGAVVGVLMIECALAEARMSLLTGNEVASLLAIGYFVSLQFSILWIFSRDVRRRIEKRRAAEQLGRDKAKETPT